MNIEMIKNMYETKAKYHEILVLEVMLCQAGIPHDFETHMCGWHICYPNSENVVCSAVEHNFSYGRDEDKIEIMGLLTEAEEQYDSVCGHLSAKDVFERIQNHYNQNRESIDFHQQTQEIVDISGKCVDALDRLNSALDET